MSSFDTFNPAAWQVEGLTVSAPHYHRPTYRSDRRGDAWKVALKATVVSLGVAAVLNVAVPAATLRAVSAIKVTPTHGGQDKVARGSEVPAGYWPRLVGALRTAPVVSDDSTDLPDPLV